LGFLTVAWSAPIRYFGQKMLKTIQVANTRFKIEVKTQSSIYIKANEGYCLLEYHFGGWFIAEMSGPVSYAAAISCIAEEIKKKHPFR